MLNLMVFQCFNENKNFIKFCANRHKKFKIAVFALSRNFKTPRAAVSFAQVFVRKQEPTHSSACCCVRVGFSRQNPHHSSQVARGWNRPPAPEQCQFVFRWLRPRPPDRERLNPTCVCVCVCTCVCSRRK